MAVRVFMKDDVRKGEGRIENYIEDVRCRVMDITRDISDEELWELIDDAIAERAADRPSLRERVAAREQIFHALRGLDVLQELLEDPQITEIMVNGYQHIFYEKGGRIFP